MTHFSHHPFTKSIRCLLIALALSVFSSAYSAALPPDNGHKNLGNVTCSNSFCHDAKVPWKTSAVPQNEFTTFNSKDAHGKAYKSLLGERSQAIAKRLGLKNPAHEEKLCLDCHANNVAVELRGRSFKIEEGVSCEACHGGSDRWLETHVSGAGDHADNVAAGLFQTENPVNRAELCMSCHLSNEKKSVTHRMLGAGHPRLVFELDTYTAAEPAHFTVNNAYKKRKHVATAIQTWALGQAMSVQSLMDNIINPSTFRKTAYPELSFFDCNSCHHKMSDKRWTAKSPSQNGPGVPRFNTANLVMLEVLAKQVTPTIAEQLSKEILGLHQSTSKSNEQTVLAAQSLRKTATLLFNQFANYSFSQQDLLTILDTLVQDQRNYKYPDYVAAEQATLAMSTLVTGLHRTGGIDEQTLKSLNLAMDPVYQSVKSDENYKAENFKAALRNFDGVFKRVKPAM
jgi:hypothetical protein